MNDLGEWAEAKAKQLYDTEAERKAFIDGFELFYRQGGGDLVLRGRELLKSYDSIRAHGEWFITVGDNEWYEFERLVEEVEALGDK